MVLTNMLHMVALIVDLHLEMDTIFTLSHTPRPTQIHTQILDTATVHQLVTPTLAHSLNHSWRVVTNLNQTKSKSSMRAPEKT